MGQEAGVKLERCRVSLQSLGRGSELRTERGQGLGAGVAPCPGAGREAGTRLRTKGQRETGLVQTQVVKDTRPLEASTLPPKPGTRLSI